MASVTALIEKDPTRGYRARTLAPLNLEAFGATEAEAVAGLQEQWKQLAQQGATLVEIPLKGSRKHRLPNFDRNDPIIQDWLRAIAENRARADQEDANSDAA